MVNKFVGWMGVKNALMSYRYSKELSFVSDDALLSTFLQAINYYSKVLTNCNIQSLTYFEKGAFDKGISFRMNSLEEDLLSVVIDEVDSMNDDFLFFEDQRSKDLMKIFYDENKERVDNKSCDLKPLREAAMQGNFSKTFEEYEKKIWKGEKKYESLLIKMYGVLNKEGGKKFFQKKSNEFYEIRPYKMSDSEDYSDENLLNLISSLNSLESEIFMNNEKKDSFFFFTMQNNEGVKYSIAEYKRKSETNPSEFDSIGVIIHMNEVPYGKFLSEKIKVIKDILVQDLNDWLKANNLLIP